MTEDYSTVIRGFQSLVDMKPPRRFEEIATLVAREEDPQKILLLAREMIRALDAKSTKHMENISAAEKTSGKEAA